MPSTIDIELRLLREQAEKDAADAAEDLKNKLGGASKKTEQSEKERAKASEQANRAEERGAKFADAAERLRQQRNRSSSQEDREKEKRAERLLRIQQRLKEIEEQPNRYGLGVGAALLAGGATISQSALGAQTAHFLGSIGSRFKAGRQLGESRQNLLEAQKSGDLDRIEDAAEEHSLAKNAVSAATRNLVMAGVAAMVTAIVKGGKEAFTNESLERGFFQRTGGRASQILPAANRDRIHALGLNQQEAVSLATDFAGATGSTEFGGGSAFEQMAKLRFSHGDAAASALTGFLGTAQQRGVLGDSTGDARDRKLAELISRGTGVAVSTNLERGRTGEAFEALRMLASSLGPGQTFDAEAAATALRMVGQDPTLRGTQGAGAVQTMEALGQGKMGGLSKMISIMGAMREGGPNQSPLELAANMEKIGRDPKALLKTMKQLAPNSEAMDSLMATFTPLFGGGMSGELAKKLSTTFQRGEVPESKKGLDTDVPENLKQMKRVSDKYADTATQLGETFRMSGLANVAEKATNLVDEVSIGAQKVVINTVAAIDYVKNTSISQMGKDLKSSYDAQKNDRPGSYGPDGMFTPAPNWADIKAWWRGKPITPRPQGSLPTETPSAAAPAPQGGSGSVNVDVTVRDPHGILHRKQVEEATVTPIGRSGMATPLPTR